MLSHHRSCARPRSRCGILTFEPYRNRGVLFLEWTISLQNGRQSMVTSAWWLWLLVILFPMVLRPMVDGRCLYRAIRSVLEARDGPFPLKRNSTDPTASLHYLHHSSVMQQFRPSACGSDPCSCSVDFPIEYSSPPLPPFSGLRCHIGSFE